MRVICSFVATLSLAVLSCRAQVSPERCCPSLFDVGRPAAFHFRCAQANVVTSCEEPPMNDIISNTAINSQPGFAPGTNSYLMSDPNWMVQVQDSPFRPDVACSFYLPKVEGHCWVLFLVKELDPIVNNDPCQCDCEDNVLFEDGIQSQKFCNRVPQGGAVWEGWCGHGLGPHNVQGLQPFVSSESTAVLTTFRNDNANGIGEGALVFAYAEPCSNRVGRKVRPTPWPASLKRTPRCRDEYARCQNQTCRLPCNCYHDRQQRVSCTLYEIFTDTTGRAAGRNYKSRCEVFRRASRLAFDNLRRFRRLVPTYEQLRNMTSPM